MYPSEPFPHFVDDYLAYLHEVFPTQAAFDGTHVHDDLLEDLSRPAIDAHVRALSGFGRRLRQIDAGTLPPTERIEHPSVAANIEARMFEFEEVCTWDRSPQMYADLVGESLAGQALFAYAPELTKKILAKRGLLTMQTAPAPEAVEEPKEEPQPPHTNHRAKRAAASTE